MITSNYEVERIDAGKDCISVSTRCTISVARFASVVTTVVASEHWKAQTEVNTAT
jgi:hypothetical protein